MLVLAIILSLLGYIFYNQQKQKNKQLKRENDLKEALLKIEAQNKLQEQRFRISRDLHDNIGAQLTFIISSLDSLKYGFKIPDKLNNKLKSISEFTSSTILELRDTIWAMNKTEITIEDLQARISNFIEKANLAASNTNFDFKVNNFKKNISLTSVEGMNVYRIIQETINNAIKYAEASQIEVIINFEKTTLEFKISDNGKGFDLGELEFGNGINNIKKRAREINAELKIDSTKGKGTEVILNKQLNT